MRNILILYLCFIGLTMNLSACYEDRGNYDYSELPHITIQAKDTVHATQFTTLELPVEMNLDDYDSKDYEFSWRLWPNDIGGVWKQKTIANTKDLSYAVTEIPGSYSLVLTCHNKQSGVNTYKQILLVVQGVITEGWMVLHEKDGKTDFDLVMSPYFSNRVDKDLILHNVYQSVNGEQLEGRGVKIGSFFCIGRYQNVTILTDKGGARLDAITMQKIFDISTLMPDMSNWKPENYLFYHYYWSPARFGYDAIISNGHFYEYSAMGAMGFTTYIEPILKDEMTYRSAAYAPRYFDYYLAIIYDELGGRFLCFPKHNNGSSTWILQEMPDNASGTVCNIKNMHAKLRYMDTGFNNYEYGLFEDWDTHANALYAFNFDASVNVDKAMYSAANCPDIQKADYFALGDLGPVFYYATDRDIYQYDYMGTNTGKKVYSLANNEERITGMKIFKPCVDRFIRSHPYNNKVLMISTYNGFSKEGKLYMYYINVSNGAIDVSSEKVIGGFGEILDMEYNFAKYGS
ncbi:PKD-like family lipoprotein [Bacteroides sp. AN502(2024)]|uniref:PKD-like family lipoprotein n=1 Tax=Bacteroides sp. AN502(2024) TaxID=3160599 RepID=UPI0035179463